MITRLLMVCLLGFLSCHGSTKPPATMKVALGLIALETHAYAAAEQHFMKRWR